MKDVQYYLALNYRKTVYRDENGVFVVEVPDLPGCVADGDTVGEALRNSDEAMEAWIASRLEVGAGVPEPRILGDFSGKFVLRLPKWLHQRLSEEADAEETSLNQCAVALLSEAVGRRGAEKQASALIHRSVQVLTDATQRIERLAEYGYRVSENRQETRLGLLTAIPIQQTQQEGSQIGAAPGIPAPTWLARSQTNRDSYPQA